MRNDFAALILTYRRPDRIRTIDALRRQGYTGKIYLVVDDKDPSLSDYQEIYGDQILTFSKAAYDDAFDIGDNFEGRAAVVWARNASFDLARSVDCRYFVQLDDDYSIFKVRKARAFRIRDLDTIFEAMVDFLSVSQIVTIAMAQGGDHIGGFDGRVLLKRKAMNSFICDVEKPFDFSGRINEDVNTYLQHGMLGKLFFTISNVQLEQSPTQSLEGGLTDIYLELGTYVKSFYSVMYSPSCVDITSMGLNYPRLHHKVNWNAAVPCILAERHKKLMQGDHL